MCPGLLAGLIPLLKSEVPPGGTYGKALFALFQYGYVWPLLAQLTLVVALVKPEALYEHALTEAIISFIFFVSHRMTIGEKTYNSRRYSSPIPAARTLQQRPRCRHAGAKYAGLSDRERRRLLHEEPVPVSLALNWRLQARLSPLPFPVARATRAAPPNQPPTPAPPMRSLRPS